MVLLFEMCWAVVCGEMVHRPLQIAVRYGARVTSRDLGCTTAADVYSPGHQQDGIFCPLATQAQVLQMRHRN